MNVRRKKIKSRLEQVPPKKLSWLSQPESRQESIKPPLSKQNPSSSLLSFESSMTARRRGRERSEPMVTPLSAMIRDSIVHGFVLCDVFSLESQRAARKIAESFSDAIVQPTPTLLYGSLQNTACYFKNTSHLYSNVLKLWHAAVTEHPVGIKVVLCSNMLKALAYGKAQKETPVIFATHDNIHFRRFVEGLTWKEWFANSLDFIRLLSLSRAEKQEIQRELKSFCEKMEVLRYRTPAQCTLMLPKTSKEEMQRRFGYFVTTLWSLWNDELTHLDIPFAHLDVFDPTELSTSLRECERYESRYALAPYEVQEALEDVFTACLTKVKARATSEWYFGLRDFSVEISCDSHLKFQETVSLALPVYEMSKTSRLALSRAIEQVCGQVINRKDGKISDDKPGSENFLEYIIHSVDELRVTPIQLYCRQRDKEALFEFERGRKTLLECRKRIEVKEDVPVAIYGLSLDCKEERSFFSIGSNGESESQIEFAINSFCQYLYCNRPLVTLSTPIQISIEELRKSFPQVKIIYSETMGTVDCFVAQLLPHADSPRLWLKHEVGKRLGPSSQEYLLAGYFDPGFQWLGEG